MDKDAIKTAKAEAKRFLARVATWEKAQGSYQHNNEWYTKITAKENGAVKRSSMDLTRALADLRRSR